MTFLNLLVLVALFILFAPFIAPMFAVAGIGFSYARRSLLSVASWAVAAVLGCAWSALLVMA